jgi:DHA2 family multidrug resistance protein
MTTAASQARTPPSGLAAAALLSGLVLATFSEAMTGTLLALGRADIMGDTAATPDSFAWLDIAYTTAKILGFATAPWLTTRVKPLWVVIGAVLGLAITAGASVLAKDLAVLIGFRTLQGLFGGIVLVAAQAVVFWAFPRAKQPLLQALFAAGAVVAPATLAPALQGWIIDGQSWTWVLAAVIPLALAAAGLLLLGDTPLSAPAAPRPFDTGGFLLLALAAVAASFTLNQGSRWNWFDDPKIWISASVALVAVIAFVMHNHASGPRALLSFSPFATEPFPFAFLISLVAGASLFGSAFVIPAFAVTILGFSPTAAGLLLLPSAAVFAGALFAAAILAQRCKVPTLIFVPIGITLVFTGLWTLAGSGPESGPQDMALPLLLRGLGLGFLFLSLTMMAFGPLSDANMAPGIALFDMGRQFGGLFGVAGLQTLIDRQTVSNLTVIGANLPQGSASSVERMIAMTNALAGRGLETAQASAAARALLARALNAQAALIAFDTAFLALALIFVVAAPVLVTVKIALSAAAKRRAARLSRLETLA